MVEFFTNTYLGMLLVIVAQILLVIVPLLVALAFLMYADRKIWAAVMMRKGPNVVGAFGLLQSFADFIKYIVKEVVFPAGADRAVFLLAPTSTQERIKKLSAVASGFVYYVSLKGVTGAATLDVARPGDRIMMVSFGSGAGSDGFIFQVTDRIDAVRDRAPLFKDMIQDNKIYLNYAEYAKYRKKIIMNS